MNTWTPQRSCCIWLTSVGRILYTRTICRHGSHFILQSKGQEPTCTFCIQGSARATCFASAKGMLNQKTGLAGKLGLTGWRPCLWNVASQLRQTFLEAYLLEVSWLKHTESASFVIRKPASMVLLFLLFYLGFLDCYLLFSLCLFRGDFVMHFWLIDQGTF